MKNKLVIAGGMHWNGTGLATIEVVAPNTKSETLPIKLPVTMTGSCMVPWNTNTFLIMGGHNGSSISRQTYFINMSNNTVTNGPSLLTGRQYFACSALNVNGEDYIIVAGGDGIGAANSTEYLQKANYASGWKKSVDLPVELEWHEIVASKGFLYTIGGYIDDSIGNDIYKFECTNSITNCSWNKIPTKSQQNDRYYTVAMLIPNELANKLCN